MSRDTAARSLNAVTEINLVPSDLGYQAKQIGENNIFNTLAKSVLA